VGPVVVDRTQPNGVNGAPDPAATTLTVNALTGGSFTGPTAALNLFAREGDLLLIRSHTGEPGGDTQHEVALSLAGNPLAFTDTRTGGYVPDIQEHLLAAPVTGWYLLTLRPARAGTRSFSVGVDLLRGAPVERGWW
jgi:hypothetical protein